MKRIVTWAALVVVVSLVTAYVVWPRALEVEAVRSFRGTAEAFVLEEAETRLDEEYEITMPVSGRLLRVDLKEGTLIEKGSVVARVDTFERQEQLKQLAARVDEIQALIVGVDKAKPKPEDIRAAELAVQEAKLRHDAAGRSLDAARINCEQEEKQYRRIEKLLAEGAVPQADFDEAERRYLMLRTQGEEAVASEGAAGKLLEQARVKLQRLRDSVDDNEYQRAAYEAQIQQIATKQAILRDELTRSEVRAPVSGPILVKYQEDEQVLPAGTPLLAMGDLDSISIESDILSEEVGRVAVGQDVEVFGPAVGPEPIAGTVSRIYPSGFEKISSLGIEQQRVKVIMAFENRDLQLRPGVRLDVKIITDRRPGALLIPEPALFKTSNRPTSPAEREPALRARRPEGGWSVFAVRNGRAYLAAVEVGVRNDEHAQVTRGLQEGDLVILNPPAQLEDGGKVAVKAREQ